MSITNYDLLINVTTGEYPRNLAQVRAECPTKSFAESPSEDALSDLGYALVHRVTPPTGDVVSEEAPMVRQGKWVQQWTSRDFTPEEEAANFVNVQAQCLSDIKALQLYTYENGYNYTFPDNSKGHVQLRDGDRANITALRVRAESSKIRNPDEEFYFRTLENVTKGPMTSDQIIVMADVVFEKYMRVLGICWMLKDAAERATNKTELPQVPPNLDAML